MKRSATAVWQGTLKEGKGIVSTKSGVLSEIPYSFGTRFGEEPGTNPEELIAAAHAGCFSMALSAGLTKAGFPPNQVKTQASLSLDNIEGGWKITAVHLVVDARVANIGAADFQKLAEDAKANCPVSRVLNATITMEAKLEG